MSFERVWQAEDAQVESGRIPGYVAVVRIHGEVEFHTGGRRALDGPPMTEDTLFRIASLTKPFAGVLLLSMIQDGLLAMDDPAAEWLPEVADARVLTSPDAPLDSTVAQVRPITVRHLATSTAGWGIIMRDVPVRRAMLDRKVHPGPMTPPMSADEYVATVAGLPLAFQPGDGWLYDTPIDLLGVLLSRAAGKPLSELVAERVTGPLGMTDTTFWTPDVHRLATYYQPTSGSDDLPLADPPDGAFSKPPAFEEMSSGLVSTAADLLRFYTALADGGAPVLTADSLALLTGDALTAEQRAWAEPIVSAGGSWGIAVGVDIEATESYRSPGRWGWTGGTGTTAYVDPARDTVSILLTQRGLTSPTDGFVPFWNAVAESA